MSAPVVLKSGERYALSVQASLYSKPDGSECNFIGLYVVVIDDTGGILAHPIPETDRAEYSPRSKLSAATTSV
ncbi:hypothetical protein Q2T42_30950 [Leptolyngbya boryana CZ1]|uniref:Uncharacterized protein n=1 Tax=Leptolyngbya boryana CZ1 TaxID=3060204 RepID=A0AA97AR39_LEPBY|nr:hypothetical protein [Leptolyngbya boryana]WNZ46209.1 hypothetical protein Q2T42_30950 [Leptolyngbya boryana CZ1]